jgi:UDP-N-acetylmuramate--alanine ligase
MAQLTPQPTALGAIPALDFVGIGGIGMSSLARWAMARGIPVSGYDKTPSDLTDALQREGARIRFDESLEAWNAPATAWVIYTPAIPADHPQLVAAKARGRVLLKRAELLGRIANAGTCLAVGGTHGKTTTSAMLAWMLHQHQPIQAFLGGIATNFASNCLPGPADLSVVEADEFDRSFLHLHPKAAVITSTDADHLDIYGEADSVVDGFRAFAGQVKGPLFSGPGCAELEGAESYGRPGDRYSYRDVQVVNGIQHFTLLVDGIEVRTQAGLPGLHNVENAVAAAALAHSVGMPAAAIGEAIAGFRGVARRFDRRASAAGRHYIDDYAHHPTELTRFIEALRGMFPGEKIALLFQPHLYSRTRDFAAGFAEALSGADFVGILPIYAARERAMAGVDSAMLAARIPGAQLVPYDRGAQWLASQPATVVATVGAGDIDRLVPRVEHLIRANA